MDNTERTNELITMAREIAQRTMMHALEHTIKTQRWNVRIAAKVSSKGTVAPSAEERKMLKSLIVNEIETVLADIEDGE